MSAEDLEKYEAEMELQLYREYRDVVGIFKYVVETDRRFYLCNQVDVKARTEAGDVFFEVSMTDAWVWDMYRPARFAKNVKVAHLQGRQRRGARQSRPGAPQELSPAGSPGGRMSRTAGRTLGALHSPVRRARRPAPPPGERLVVEEVRRWRRHDSGWRPVGTARRVRRGTWSELGMVVLDRNWRCVAGEIDLVLRDGPVLVFCEVKTRASAAFGAPLEAVSAAKVARLRRLAARWMNEHGVYADEVRLDLVGVRLDVGGRAASTTCGASADGFATARTVTLTGVSGHVIDVQADVTQGLVSTTWSAGPTRR